MKQKLYCSRHESFCSAEPPIYSTPYPRCIIVPLAAAMAGRAAVASHNRDVARAEATQESGVRRLGRRSLDLYYIQNR